MPRIDLQNERRLARLRHTAELSNAAGTRNSVYHIDFTNQFDGSALAPVARSREPESEDRSDQDKRHLPDQTIQFGGIFVARIRGLCAN